MPTAGPGQLNPIDLVLIAYLVLVFPVVQLKTWGQAGGSVISAFLFTIAYALTASLWWLMIIHTAAALLGGWTGFRMARTQPSN